MSEGETIKTDKDLREEIGKPPVRSPEVYQSLLDPENALPAVTLREEALSDVKSPWRSMKIYNSNGDAVGVVMVSDTNVPGTTFIVDIRLFEGHENNRYGRSAYVTLVKQLASEGTRLLSGNSLSRDALDEWEWMVKKGAARLVLYREPNESAKNRGYSTSLYEII
ncbi:MAG: hypothetical protein KBD05_02395 [Candidatus Pacebacteria bacterium]|nr:hypothetical protein [Candidatus Paceibacterota bacterium]